MVPEGGFEPPTRGFSDKWFHNNLPSALGTITVPSFDAAIELVAEGLATAHAPLSIVPNLKATTLEKVRFYDIKSKGPQIVIAMHKHLITHSSYSKIYKSLFDYCSQDHFNAMAIYKIKSNAFKFNEDMTCAPLSSPQFMYHLLIEFLGRVASCTEIDEA